MKKHSTKTATNTLRNKMDLSVIITAGGSSTRYGNRNKLLEKIKGKEVILHSIDAFLPLAPDEIIISASESLEPIIKELIKKYKNTKVVRGGKTRQESVFNGLKACTGRGLVAIHDAARPLVRTKDIENCIKKAQLTNAAILCVKATDTIKKVDDSGKIIETPDRNYLWCVQTPQIFNYELILNAHNQLKGKSFSDDAGLLESLNIPVYAVEGSYSNIKITTGADLEIAESLINIS